MNIFEGEWMVDSRMWDPSEEISLTKSVDFAKNDTYNTYDGILKTDTSLVTIVGLAKETSIDSECIYSVLDLDDGEVTFKNGVFYVNATIDLDYQNFDSYNPALSCTTLKISLFDNVEATISNITIVGTIYLLNADLRTNITEIQFSPVFGNLIYSSIAGVNIPITSVNSNLTVKVVPSALITNNQMTLTVSSYADATVLDLATYCTNKGITYTANTVGYFDINGHTIATGAITIPTTQTELITKTVYREEYNVQVFNHSHHYAAYVKKTIVAFFDVKNPYADSLEEDLYVNSFGKAQRVAMQTQRTTFACFTTDTSETEIQDFIIAEPANCGTMIYYTPTFALALPMDQTSAIQCQNGLKYNIKTAKCVTVAECFAAGRFSQGEMCVKTCSNGYYSLTTDTEKRCFYGGCPIWAGVYYSGTTGVCSKDATVTATINSSGSLVISGWTSLHDGTGAVVTTCAKKRFFGGCYDDCPYGTIVSTTNESECVYPTASTQCTGDNYIYVNYTQLEEDNLYSYPACQCIFPQGGAREATMTISTSGSNEDWQFTPSNVYVFNCSQESAGLCITKTVNNVTSFDGKCYVGMTYAQLFDDALDSAIKDDTIKYHGNDTMMKSCTSACFFSDELRQDQACVAKCSTYFVKTLQSACKLCESTYIDGPFYNYTDSTCQTTCTYCNNKSTIETITAATEANIPERFYSSEKLNTTRCPLAISREEYVKVYTEATVSTNVTNICLLKCPAGYIQDDKTALCVKTCSEEQVYEVDSTGYAKCKDKASCLGFKQLDNVTIVNGTSLRCYHSCVEVGDDWWVLTSNTTELVCGEKCAVSGTRDEYIKYNDESGNNAKQNNSEKVLDRWCKPVCDTDTYLQGTKGSYICVSSCNGTSTLQELIDTDTTQNRTKCAEGCASAKFIAEVNSSFKLCVTSCTDKTLDVNLSSLNTLTYTHVDGTDNKTCLTSCNAASNIVANYTISGADRKVCQPICTGGKIMHYNPDNTTTFFWCEAATSNANQCLDNFLKIDSMCVKISSCGAFYTTKNYQDTLALTTGLIYNNDNTCKAACDHADNTYVYYDENNICKTTCATYSYSLIPADTYMLYCVTTKCPDTLPNYKLESDGRKTCVLCASPNHNVADMSDSVTLRCVVNCKESEYETGKTYLLDDATPNTCVKQADCKSSFKYMVINSSNTDSQCVTTCPTGQSFVNFGASKDNFSCVLACDSGYPITNYAVNAGKTEVKTCLEKCGDGELMYYDKTGDKFECKTGTACAATDLKIKDFCTTTVSTCATYISDYASKWSFGYLKYTAKNGSECLASCSDTTPVNTYNKADSNNLYQCIDLADCTHYTVETSGNVCQDSCPTEKPYFFDNGTVKWCVAECADLKKDAYVFYDVTTKECKSSCSGYTTEKTILETLYYECSTTCSLSYKNMTSPTRTACMACASDEHSVKDYRNSVNLCVKYCKDALETETATYLLQDDPKGCVTHDECKTAFKYKVASTGAEVDSQCVKTCPEAASYVDFSGVKDKLYTCDASCSGYAITDYSIYTGKTAVKTCLQKCGDGELMYYDKTNDQFECKTGTACATTDLKIKDFCTTAVTTCATYINSYASKWSFGDLKYTAKNGSECLASCSDTTPVNTYNKSNNKCMDLTECAHYTVEGTDNVCQDSCPAEKPYYHENKCVAECVDIDANYLFYNKDTKECLTTCNGYTTSKTILDTTYYECSSSCSETSYVVETTPDRKTCRACVTGEYTVSDYTDTTHAKCVTHCKDALSAVGYTYLLDVATNSCITQGNCKTGQKFMVNYNAYTNKEVDSYCIATCPTTGYINAYPNIQNDQFTCSTDPCPDGTDKTSVYIYTKNYDVCKQRCGENQMTYYDHDTKAFSCKDGTACVDAILIKSYCVTNLDCQTYESTYQSSWGFGSHLYLNEAGTECMESCDATSNTYIVLSSGEKQCKTLTTCSYYSESVDGGTTYKVCTATKCSKFYYDTDTTTLKKCVTACTQSGETYVYYQKDFKCVSSCDATNYSYNIAADSTNDHILLCTDNCTEALPAFQVETDGRRTCVACTGTGKYKVNDTSDTKTLKCVDHCKDGLSEAGKTYLLDVTDTTCVTQAACKTSKKFMIDFDAYTNNEADSYCIEVCPTTGYVNKYPLVGSDFFTCVTECPAKTTNVSLKIYDTPRDVCRLNCESNEKTYYDGASGEYSCKVGSACVDSIAIGTYCVTNLDCQTYEADLKSSWNFGSLPYLNEAGTECIASCSATDNTYILATNDQKQCKTLTTCSYYSELVDGGTTYKVCTATKCSKFYYDTDTTTLKKCVAACSQEDPTYVYYLTDYKCVSSCGAANYSYYDTTDSSNDHILLCTDNCTAELPAFYVESDGRRTCVACTGKYKVNDTSDSKTLKCVSKCKSGVYGDSMNYVLDASTNPDTCVTQKACTDAGKYLDLSESNADYECVQSCTSNAYANSTKICVADDCGFFFFADKATYHRCVAEAECPYYFLTADTPSRHKCQAAECNYYADTSKKQCVDLGDNYFYTDADGDRIVVKPCPDQYPHLQGQECFEHCPNYQLYDSQDCASDCQAPSYMVVVADVVYCYTGSQCPDNYTKLDSSNECFCYDYISGKKCGEAADTCATGQKLQDGRCVEDCLTDNTAVEGLCYANCELFDGDMMCSDTVNIEAVERNKSGADVLLIILIIILCLAAVGLGVVCYIYFRDNKLKKLQASKMLKRAQVISALQEDTIQSSVFESDSVFKKADSSLNTSNPQQSCMATGLSQMNDSGLIQ